MHMHCREYPIIAFLDLQLTVKTRRNGGTMRTCAFNTIIYFTCYYSIIRSASRNYFQRPRKARDTRATSRASMQL